MYEYGRNFMGLAAKASHSADAIIGHLLGSVRVTSVADFGCARGTWLSAWQRRGVADVLGLDGPYVNTTDLEISPQNFQACDLSKPIDLGQQFSLVQSLEVAEHLPSSAAEEFVTSLTRHAPLVLFSASPPGQGGENHVNERPYEYWRGLFAERGYAMLDWLRPRIQHDQSIQYWYRFNAFLFAAEPVVPTLPRDWQAARVPQTGRVRDVSPAWFRARKQIVQVLPKPVQTALSRMMSTARTMAE